MNSFRFADQITNFYEIVYELSSVDFSSKGFVGTKVAYKNENSVKLEISNDELINSFNTYSSKYGLNKRGESFEMLEIEGKYYIRFTNTDDSVSISIHNVYILG